LKKDPVYPPSSGSTSIIRAVEEHLRNMGRGLASTTVVNMRE
jgi:hypothetical protein